MKQWSLIMIEIDWRKIATKNGLSMDEFRDKIFATALALGMMALEESESNTMKWSTDYGVILVTPTPKGDTDE